MASPQPRTSIEAFALALVEASSRIEGTASTLGGEPTVLTGALDEDAAPAAE